VAGHTAPRAARRFHPPFEEHPMNRTTIALSGLLLVAFGTPALAQDAVKVDGKHYKIEFENDQVRVLRVTYGPHEKSVQHSHPDGVVIFLNDSHAKFWLPDGKSRESTQKAGTAMWAPAETHTPENLENKPMEVMLIEMKKK
jgi:quercetin dioxygenase-like cupin family protein